MQSVKCHSRRRIAHRRTLSIELLENRRLLNADSHWPANIDRRLVEAFASDDSAAGPVTEVVQHANALAPPFHGVQSSRFVVDSEQHPLVRVWTHFDAESVALDLAEMGARVYAASRQHHLVEASIAPEQIPAVAKMPSVLSVTAVHRPINRAGNVQTQGDAIIQADDVRDDGFNGDPFLVGVLSDTFYGETATQTSGDLPAIIDNYLAFDLLVSPARSEAAAIMEVVHDIAPGARLAHHSAAGGELSFAQGIRTLAAAGSKVIVDDVYYYSEPFFQDGIIAQAIDEIVEQYGVAHFSAAGNDADRSYEAEFLDNGAGIHDFDPTAGDDTRQKITLPDGVLGTLVLQWDDPFYTLDGVTHDFGVRIYDDSGVLVGTGSDNDNIALQEPLEVVQWVGEGNGVYEVEIIRNAGPGLSRLKYVLSTNSEEGSIDEFVTASGTVVGHAAAAGAIAVGAVPYYDPASIEPYSSVGDSTIYFDPTGNRLSSPEFRQKPDLVAPDAVNTSFFGDDIPQDEDDHPNFTGTSAAAPHAAATAALVLDVNPHLTRDELYDVLTTTATDLGDIGRDRVFGAGLIDAEAARMAATNVTDVTAPRAQLLSPQALHGWEISEIKIGFSEPVVRAPVEDPTNYELVEAGDDGQFGTADDITHQITPIYDEDSRTVMATLASPTSELSLGTYHITLNTDAITDPFGNALVGGVFEFTIANMSQVDNVDTLSGTHGDFDQRFNHIALRPDGTTVLAHSSNPRSPTVTGGHSQLMVGALSHGGESQGPFRSIPAHIVVTPKVEWIDLAVNSFSGVVAYGKRFELTFDLYVQLIDAAGRPVGEPVLVAVDDTGFQPAVAMNESGKFVVASDSRFDLQGRLFLSDGSPATNNFLVASLAQSHDVAIADSGKAIFAWQSSFDSDRDGDGAAVFARVFDSTGQPLSDDFLVNTTTVGDQLFPTVAVANDGSFVIGWRECRGNSGNPCFPENRRAFFRRFDANGNPLGGEVVVAARANSLTLDMAPDGRFVVVWDAPDGDGTGVVAQRFAADGVPFGGPLLLTKGLSGSQRLPFDVEFGTQFGVEAWDSVSIADDGDFVVSWFDQAPDSSFHQQVGWFNWDGPDDEHLFSPWVRSLSPSAMASDDAPFNLATITFNKPIDTSTFFASDVLIHDPTGQVIPVDAVTVIPGSRSMKFKIAFADQFLPGTYRIAIGPEIADEFGNTLDRNGDFVFGGPDDVYEFTVELEGTAAVFPYSEGFESGDIRSLAGWSFASNEGVIVIAGENNPHSGEKHLKFDHTSSVTGTQEAILQLDLSDHSSATDMVLDFWMQKMSLIGNSFILHISGDAQSWSLVDNLSLGASDVYRHVAFDLDHALSNAGIVPDDDVYIRWRHISSVNPRDRRDVTLDDVRVSTVDAFGARITAHSPSGVVSQPVGSMTLTFNEPIDSSTFTIGDITITGPSGTFVDLAGDPVDSGDGLTFTVNFTEVQTLAGTYLITLSPDVLDIAGNAMNQDEDAIQGELDEDRYQASFQLGPPLPQSAPLSEGFESGNILSLAGWSFSTTAGLVEATADDQPNTGGFHLQFQSDANVEGTRAADVLLDLSANSDSTELALTFWHQQIGNRFIQSSQFLVSGNGVDWIRVLTLGDGAYEQHSVDLDQVLADSGIAVDADVYLRFRHSGRVASSKMTIDDIQLTVAGAAAPFAQADFAETNEDSAVQINVLANDVEASDSLLPATVTVFQSPHFGDVTVDSQSGLVTYSPPLDFSGVDSLQYRVTTVSGRTLSAAVVITVNPTNDAPLAVGDTYSTDEDTALTIILPGVLVNDTDIDSGALTAVLHASPGSGAVSFNSDGSFTYTPSANFNGVDAFTYKANDGSLDSNVASVTINVAAVNDKPFAEDNSYNTDEDTPLIVAVAAGVLANDTDVDNDLLTAAKVAEPTNGSLVLNNDGSFTYTPNADFNGVDTFTYTANDSSTASNISSVNITILPVNDAPEITFGEATVKRFSYGDVVGAISITDPDVDDSHVVSVSDARFEVQNGQLKLRDDQFLDQTVEDTIPLLVTVQDFGIPALESSKAIDVQVLHHAPWQNPDNRRDVTNDGFIAPDDVLGIINELLLRTLADSTGFLPAPRIDEAFPPPFIDPTGDNIVAPDDALFIINWLLTVTHSPVRAGIQLNVAIDGEFAPPPSTPSSPSRDIDEIAAPANRENGVVAARSVRRSVGFYPQSKKRIVHLSGRRAEEPLVTKSIEELLDEIAADLSKNVW